MNVQTEPRIIAAERIGNSVLIMFGDGEHGVFSASLLHDTLPQAEQVIEEDDEELEA